MNDTKLSKTTLIASLFIAILVVTYFAGRGLVGKYYFQRGVQKIEEKNLREARISLKRALLFSPRDARIYAELGFISRPDTAGEEGDGSKTTYEEAVMHYEKALSLGFSEEDEPRFGKNVPLYLGNAYRGLKKYEKAREVFLKQLEQYPNTFWSRYMIAWDDWQRFNNAQEALDILLPAVDSLTASQEDLYRLYSLLSSLYYYFEDYENAEKYAKLSLENAAAGKKVLHAQVAYYTLALVDGRKKRFSLAEEAIKESNTLAGSLHANDCVLARAYYLGEDYTRAINVAQGAEQSKDALVYSTCLRVLGDAFLAKKNTVEAQKYFTQYLEYVGRTEIRDIFTVRAVEDVKKKLESL